MRIRHEPPVVRGKRPDQLHDGLLRHKQDYVQQHRADDVKPEMNKRRPLCVLLSRKGCQQRRCTRADVTAQNDIQGYVQGQQILICQKQHNADRHGGALYNGGQKQTHKSRHKGVFQGLQHSNHLGHISHFRHGARHGAQTQEQYTEADNDIGKLFHLVILAEHHK